MKISHCIDVDWSVAAEPSYQRDYLRIAAPVSYGADWLVLDRNSLLQVTSSGVVEARISCARAGLWEVPAVLGPNIFTLDLVDGLHRLDPSGNELSNAKLQSSPCTGILTVPQSSLWVGVGWTECEVLRIDDQGQITARQAVAREGGLRRDLVAAYTPSGECWILISTATGMCSVDAQTGNIFNQLSSRACISAALPAIQNPGTAWVVERDANAGCYLTHFAWTAARANAANAMAVTLNSLPIAHEVREATLHATRDGGLWLTGTTADPDESPTESDRVLVLRIGASGEIASTVLPAGGAVDAAVDAKDRLWVSVNSDEPAPCVAEGYLAVLDDSAELIAEWQPADGGVGRSCFRSADQAVVCTSSGLHGVTLR